MADLPVVVRLPSLAEALPGVVDASMPTGDEDRAYNALCTSLVRAALEAERDAGRPALVLTAYPGQESEHFDLVGLGDDGGVRVIFGVDEASS